MATQRKGLLGGTFDPPHAAHVALAQCAMQTLGLDALKVIPAGQPWQRSPAPSAAVHRLAMCQLAFAGIAGVEIDDREVRRSGPTYTVDTVHELKNAEPDTEWHLIVGADQAQHLNTWYQWEELLCLVHLVVAQRPNSAGQWQNSHMLQAISLPFDPMDLSSTAVRGRLGQGLEVSGLNPQVSDYIRLHQLYRHSSS
jgi:nicotinate-nucleotide adenylyltransferase